MEIIEIAENIAERRDQRLGQTSQTSGGASGSGGANPKNKHQSADSSVRLVTFRSRHKNHGKQHKKPYPHSNDGSQQGMPPQS